MPDIMSVPKRPGKIKHLKNELMKEINFMKNIFSVMSIPLQRKVDEDDIDFEMTSKAKDDNIQDISSRARSILELEEKLEKMKSQNKFNLKSKLVKKSLNSKLSKKIKKERVKLNKTKIKTSSEPENVSETKDKSIVSAAKPIFNNDGKLVFSKFDFANFGGQGKSPKTLKDPKKILDNLKQQEQKFRELENEDGNKVKEIKEKIAWKNILQKAEGQKVKDDPTLLKKSIKKMEQKKKVSKKQWENRIKNVEQKKDERQKKRKENISKKKKEKKSKIVKAAVKRGRVVI